MEIKLGTKAAAWHSQDLTTRTRYMSEVLDRIDWMVMKDMDVEGSWKYCICNVEELVDKFVPLVRPRPTIETTLVVQESRNSSEEEAQGMEGVC